MAARSVAAFLWASGRFGMLAGVSLGSLDLAIAHMALWRLSSVGMGVGVGSAINSTLWRRASASASSSWAAAALRNMSLSVWSSYSGSGSTSRGCGGWSAW